jgi:hypothetical protein
LARSDLKQLLEENKFIAGDSEENVAAWGESIEENVALADEKVKQLGTGHNLSGGEGSCNSKF